MLVMEVWFEGGGILCAPALTQTALSTADWKNVADIVGTLVKSIAVILGGVWAYFKFVKGRTFHTRLSVSMRGEWIEVSGRDLLHLRVSASNIGGSVVSLKQYGSGLRVSFPSIVQDSDEFAWDPVLYAAIDAPRDVEAPHTSGLNSAPPRWFEVFEEHEWVEPGETVSDDLLLNLRRDPDAVLLELTLIWNRAGHTGDKLHKKDVELSARQVLRIDSVIEEGGDAKNNKRRRDRLWPGKMTRHGILQLAGLGNGNQPHRGRKRSRLGSRSLRH